MDSHLGGYTFRIPTLQRPNMPYMVFNPTLNEITPLCASDAGWSHLGDQWRSISIMVMLIYALRVHRTLLSIAGTRSVVECEVKVLLMPWVLVA
jgi:hypothetical protein